MAVGTCIYLYIYLRLYILGLVEGLCSSLSRREQVNLFTFSFHFILFYFIFHFTHLQ